MHKKSQDIATPDAFALMGEALKTEAASDHPSAKVGAVISGYDHRGNPFHLSRANYWPKILKESIPQDAKLGNASTTVHAEIAALLAAPRTQDCTLYITDLPCPNCAKMMAEAGITHLYIDSNAEQSALGQKMKPYFENTSKMLLEAAGIGVSILTVQNQSISPLFAPNPTAHRTANALIQNLGTEALDSGEFTQILDTATAEIPKGTAWAAAFARNSEKVAFLLILSAALSPGLTEEQAERITNAQSKYSPLLQPLDRLLLGAHRLELQIEPQTLTSAHVPTAREFVNIIGAGFTTLTIRDERKSRDAYGPSALAQLRSFGVIRA